MALPTPLVAMLIWAFFDRGNQVGDGLGLDLAVENDDVRHVAGQRDRREIFQRIVAELCLHERVDGQRTIRGDQQRVAVRRRPRHGFGADAAAGATAVFDHHGLAQGIRYAVADDAADNVGIAAGGKRHDQADRPLGIFRKGCPRQQRKALKQRQDRQ